MYRQKLDRISPTAIEVLRNHLLRPVEPGVLSVNVVIFPGVQGESPSAWIYYSGDHNKVDHADTRLFSGRSMELPVGLEGLSDIDERYFTDVDEFDGVALVVPLLSRWLAECWWKAGGWSYPIPTMLFVDEFGRVGREVLTEAVKLA
ncbi:hypothetical protein [Stenotrophomonas sp. PS02289]|uniref:hypothetical protein n=1 Tax=Stenotrophomonas sp. PS02289 TaxID=2991422 RepID=UPI00249C0BD8|nr:hypothetical protein [Stenotrophomonas sp. PS02289]